MENVENDFSQNFSTKPHNFNRKSEVFEMIDKDKKY